MKKIVCFIFYVCFTTIANATFNDSRIINNLPDSVKAIQFMAEINVSSINGNKEVFAGIKTGVVKLSL